MKEAARTDAQRLEDMRDALRRIARFTEGVSRSEFLGNSTLQDAVAFRIMALGEAAGRVSKRTRNANPKINWQRLSNFRNEPAHEYYALRPEHIWDFIHAALPELESRLHKVKPASDGAAPSRR